MLELLNNASKQYYLINACFKYNKELIDSFKSLGYRWNQEEKSWYKITDLDSIQINREKVENLIGITGYELTVQEVPIQDRYKKLVH